MASELEPDSARPREPRKPSLSVVVVVYNMQRAASRTLFSLSAAYQRDIDGADYEVIVVDNGSTPAFDRRTVESLQGNFRLIRIDPASPSPARALNRGLAEAKGDVIGAMIDGARLVTPGLLHFARCGARLYDNAVVATLGWYLGHDLQRMSIRAGYDEAREDALLAGIDWQNDGYRLFEIATLDESSLDGWFYPVQESNAFFMHRRMWAAISGFEERFDAPGGGLVNLDTYRRALELPGARLVRLLGEGTFHQLHGGSATSAPVERLHADLARWAEQYEAIRGQPFQIPIPKTKPTYLGVLPRFALVHFLRAALDPVWPTIWRNAPGVEPPLGRSFDRTLWSCGPIQPPSNRSIAAAVALAQEEFRGGRHDAAASIARLVYRHDPADMESRRLLALACGWLLEGDASGSRSPSYHRVLAKAHELLGERDLAARHRRIIYRAHLKQALKRMALFAIEVASALAHPLDTAARKAAQARWQSALWPLAARLLRRR